MFLRAFLLLALLSLTASGAAITQLPFTISKPGQYTLLKSMRYNGVGNAITVAADDVTIDLRGFTIEGDPAKMVANQTAAVASVSRKNITVRNGTIRSFFRGIYLEGTDTTGGHLIEDLRVDSCALLGIQVKGRFSIVRQNRVTSITSTTSISSIRYGIFVEGSNTRVAENEVQDVTPVPPAGFVYGILALRSERVTIERNRVQQLDNASVNGYGIHLDDSPAAIVQGNQISSFNGGIVFTSSLFGKYRDNTCTDCTGSYSGGTDAGNNR